MRDLWQRHDTVKLHYMRDREAIDSELRRVAAKRQAMRERGFEPSARDIDELLDERLSQRAEAREALAVQAREATCGTRVFVSVQRQRCAAARVARLAALPLSIAAAATVFTCVVTFGAHRPPPPTESAAPPPTSAISAPAAPSVYAAPRAAAPPHDFADQAFTEMLEQEGVPVPGREYATNHGHAVCNFLATQPKFSEAVKFVQRSTTWDANQSGKFAAGAIVSYCPEYEHTTFDQAQQPLQDTVSDLQAVQGRLDSILGDLRRVQYAGSQ